MLLTQEEMVINVRGQNIFDRSELLDGDLGLVVEGSRGDNPDVTRRELDGGGTATHREPPEEPGKWSREGDEFRGDLCHSEFRFGIGLIVLSKYLTNDGFGHLCERRERVKKRWWG